MALIRTDISPAAAGYTPAQIEAAYGLTSASGTNGASQTIAIVDPFDDPKAESDLGVYRSTFGLPPCTTANGCFLKVNQSGNVSPLPGTDTTGGWEAEESLDLDMASAVCPNCEITFVEAVDPSTTNLFAAEDTAANVCQATVISNSWDGQQFAGETSQEVHFNHPGIPITVASGDNGYNFGMDGYPSGSAFVTAVGGTTLMNPGMGSQTETAWSGTGSLCSQFIAQPAYQTTAISGYPAGCSMRIVVDVAAVADTATPVQFYDTFGGSMGCPSFCNAGGTSVATPIIAGVYALAGNGNSIALGYAYAHTSSFHDITSGSDGSCSPTYLCTARAGYDGPTGVGTPNGIGGF